jgi:hypothetical protein
MDVVSSQRASAAPATGCKATRQDLLDTRNVPSLGPLGFCPMCEDSGVRCRVGSHPDRPPAPVPAVSGEFVEIFFIIICCDHGAVNVLVQIVILSDGMK